MLDPVVVETLLGVDVSDSVVDGQVNSLEFAHCEDQRHEKPRYWLGRRSGWRRLHCRGRGARRDVSVGLRIGLTAGRGNYRVCSAAERIWSLTECRSRATAGPLGTDATAASP